MAVVLAAALLVAPVLPRSDGVDHTADEVRLELVTQIRAHRAFVRRVRRERRQDAAAAAQAAQAPSVEVAGPTPSGTWAGPLRVAGFPEWAIPTMLAIIQRESGGDPNALNPTSNACGLTQIWPYVPGCLDPMTNLRLAFAKFQASGFAPWGL